ncbi:MAG: hypothetical protein V2B19_16285 [Pseudomonadota bacterium]
MDEDTDQPNQDGRNLQDTQDKSTPTLLIILSSCQSWFGQRFLGTLVISPPVINAAFYLTE